MTSIRILVVLAATTAIAAAIACGPRAICVCTDGQRFYCDDVTPTSCEIPDAGAEADGE